MTKVNFVLWLVLVLPLVRPEAGYSADDAAFQLFGQSGILADSRKAEEMSFPPNPSHPFRFSASMTGAAQAEFGGMDEADPTITPPSEKTFPYRRPAASNTARLQRAELFSLGAQLLGMGLLQAADAWHTGHRPFSDTRDNLRRAWTKAPSWDSDSYFYNYIGHPYTGAFTYNLMRSQNASPVVSWLFSSSQSLIWEFSLEATEQQPSIQDLLFTSNVGSLMGEGFHRLAGKLRKDGLSWKEKIVILVLNPAHVLNNGFR